MHEDLTDLGSVAPVWEENARGVRPFLHLAPVAPDSLYHARLDGIAVGHLDRRGQDLGESEASPLRYHRHEATRRTWSDHRVHAGGRRIVQLLALEVVGCRPGGSYTRRVDPDDALLDRMVDERLRLTAPRQPVPHRGGRAQHRGGRIHRVSALLKHHRSGRGGHRLPGDRDPMLGVQHRLLCTLSGDEARRAECGSQSERGEARQGLHGNPPCGCYANVLRRIATLLRHVVEVNHCFSMGHSRRVSFLSPDTSDDVA